MELHVCPTCDGNGWSAVGSTPAGGMCGSCRGSGEVTAERRARLLGARLLAPPEQPPYREGTRSDMNVGRACWSCWGMMGCAPAPSCIYPDSHGHGRFADATEPAGSAADA